MVQKAALTAKNELLALDVFGGCGGMQMHGSAMYGDEKLSIETVGAVEIEEDPAATYRKNFPGVNVMQIGISRFLATGRRLSRLKGGKKGGKEEELTKVVKGTIIGLKIDIDRAQQVDDSKKEKRGMSTCDRQVKDDVSEKELEGSTPLSWLYFNVKQGGSNSWVAEERVSKPSIRAYLNSERFDVRVFPLPGNIHVLTGGPPCQGWSGFNRQRLTTKDLGTLLTDCKNSLLLRFLDVDEIGEL